MAQAIDPLRTRLEQVLTQEYQSLGLRKLPGNFFFFDDILKLPDFRGYSREQLSIAIHGDGLTRFSARGSKVRLKPPHLNKDADVRLSKKLAWLLRHGAESVHMKFNNGGFLFIDDLLRLPHFGAYSFADIARVVERDQKGRYELRVNPKTARPELRATQGHSLKVDGLDYTLIRDPALFPIVVHGTYFKNWPSIQVQGLGRLLRNHIHFAIGEPGEDGVVSGMRRSAEILIFVDLAAAIRDDFQFFVSSNKVILCPGDANGFLPTRYFRDVYQRRPRLRLQFKRS